MDQCDGLSFVDSSSIEVCKRYRISMNKVFAGIAASSKTTKGWFYGLKLHLIINRAGGIVKASIMVNEYAIILIILSRFVRGVTSFTI
ncbi:MULTISPECIES: transposase [spotted fever group]|uniref:transposase n=1 Tax=spotted fever group TaxID=114277 RepID=UPI0001A60830|nr:transposase [Rickettsia endosymbiont of Ixodes scapularis]EER21169.1 ISPg3, transposase [Rickettsia endosymbiont of Ixodes scapularis]